jgi:hypothetical protein
MKGEKSMGKRLLLGIVLSLLVILLGCPKSSTKNPISSNVPVYHVGDTTYVLVLSNDSGENSWIEITWDDSMSVPFKFKSIDVSSVAPTKAYMDSFNVVLLFEDGLFSNAPVVGDSVYKYVMGGGNLVIGTFYDQDRTDNLHYSPYTWGTLETIDPLHHGSCLYVYDSLGTIFNHPVTQQIAKLYTYYRGGLDSVKTGGVAVAFWADSTIFIGVNQPGPAPGGRITQVTTFPAEPFLRGPAIPGAYRDFYKIWEHALMWSAWQQVPTGLSTYVINNNRINVNYRLFNQPKNKMAGRGGTGEIR